MIDTAETIDRLLPHRPPIRVVRRITIHAENRWTCPLQLRTEDWTDGSPGNGIPAFWALEWMAQAAGLGLSLAENGDTTPSGRLALIRNFEAQAFSFPCRELWSVYVERRREGTDGLWLFHAELTDAEAARTWACAEFCLWVQS
ncbi:MAG: hypothetical protein JJU00_07805 [Opitutales bacterium]|nr:hypothetical protein [Opitutales bacterium]